MNWATCQGKIKKSLTLYAALASLLFAAGAGFFNIAKQLNIEGVTRFGDGQTTRYLIETTGPGVAIFDYDGDGKNDLLVMNGGRDGDTSFPPPMLYRNAGSGFEPAPGNGGIQEGGWGQGVCAADADNDGDVDLFLTYFGVSRFYQNEGGKFVESTAKAGFPAAGHRWGAGCAWTDYDRDGRLDLFVASYVDITFEKSPKPGSAPECMWKDTPVACGPRGLPMARNVLYHQRADGTFEDVSLKAGILKPGGRYGLGVTAADFNNDGWPDIYVACDQTPSLLFENLRNGTFRERGVEAGVAYDNNGRAQAGMGIGVADFDGNGLLDIAKTNFSGDMPSLYLNEDGSFFRDTAAAAGLGKHLLLGWGTAFVDFDEDGRPDLVMANGHVYPEVDRAGKGETYKQPTLLYRNLGGGKFEDWSAKAGAAFVEPKASRGLAFGDLDGDGRPEIVIANMNAAPSVLHNEFPRGNWLRVQLKGTSANRSAIGARVTVEAGGKRQILELTAGSSYFSQHEHALYFGLGAASKIDRAIVRWPNREATTWESRNVAVNQTVTFTENAR